MMQISHLRHHTLVKILSNTLIVCSLFSGTQAVAQTTPATTPPATTAPPANSYATPDTTCATLTAQHGAAIAKIGEACSKAGLGSECSVEALQCDEEIVEDSPSSWGALGTMFGVNPQVVSSLQGLGGDGGSAVCPQMNAKDYKTEKTAIDKEIKDTNKEIADLRKEMVEDQKTYDERALEIKRDLDQAEKDLKAKNREIDQREREQLAELTKSQQDAQKELRTITSTMLTVQGQMTVLLRQRATSLLEFTADISRAKCNVDINKRRAEYVQSVAKGKNYVADSSKKKAYLISVYNACMEDLNKKRTGVIQDSNQAMKVLEKQLADLKSDQDNISDSIALANSQLAEMKKANEEEKNDELAALLKKNQDSQTELTNLYKETQSKIANNQSQIATLEASLQRLNAQITSLGPVPKTGTSYTASQASSDINAQLEILGGIKQSASGNSGCSSLGGSIDQTIRKYKNGGGTR